MTDRCVDRREFCTRVAGAVACAGALIDTPRAAEPPFRLRYILASCLYGKAPLAEIVPEVHKTGADSIELWAEPHGNQREQLDQLGEERFLQLLTEHSVRLGSVTCFKLGVFSMQDEMRFVKRLGGDLVICNTPKPQNVDASGLKPAVRDFADKLRPHVEFAESIGMRIGIENHRGGIIHTPDSLRWLLELLPSPVLGIALAPSHLPQNEEVISGLIRDLGPRLLHVQAWEEGRGFLQKLPKEQELMQLPHRGPLDWTPMLAALRDINYQGRTEIFMHPTPRGVAILNTTAAVTAEINVARAYLDMCLQRT